MSTKYYCDVCQEQILQPKKAWSAQRGKFAVTLNQGRSLPCSSDDDLHCCMYCAIDILNQLDDRPQEP